MEYVWAQKQYLSFLAYDAGNAVWNLCMECRKLVCTKECDMDAMLRRIRCLFLRIPRRSLVYMAAYREKVFLG